LFHAAGGGDDRAFRRAGCPPYFPAAGLEGVLVNQHLGQADEFFVFRPRTGGGFEEVEIRPAPAPGRRPPR
jgi:nitrogen fixation protein NifB